MALLTRWQCICLALASVSLFPTLSEADTRPLALAEARIGQGVALGGGAGQGTWRMSATSLSALASYAIRSEPWVAVYGGLLLETNDRASAGGTLGLRVMPREGALRLSAAGSIIALPYTAYGVTGGVGRCFGLSGGIGVCADLEATVFGLGSDLPEDRIATQLQGVLGVAFNVL